MDLQLDFAKSDNEAWGFRVKGGAEYDLPILVVHVAENGVADRGGLRCNDVIVSVNGTPTDGLIHHETHALLVAAGNNLILGIKRGLTDLISPVTYDDESNEEVCNIMQAYIQSDEEPERHVDFEIINPTEELVTVEEKSETVPQPNNPTAAPLRENVILGVKEKKWSSFLQKPKNPVPKPKQHEEGPQAEPYRVIITKQKKRSPEEVKYKKLQKNKIEEEVPEPEQIEVTEEDERASIIPEEEISHIEDLEAERENEDEAAEEKLDEEVEEEEEKENAEENNTPDEECLSQEEARIEEDAEMQKFLGEKLAEVQKQLEALSKLPSTMQTTIDALYQQLASLVNLNKPENEDEDPSRGNSESGDDAAEQMITEDDNELENIEIDEENEPVDEAAEEETEEQLEQEHEEVNEDADKEPELTEEQKEALRIEEELREKQQKEQELLAEFQQRRLKQKPTLPCRPIQRPIILPGGRRWSQPDDAIPVVRSKKMSDEKIANTIETYSEVIAGRTKGLTTGTRFGPGPIGKSPFAGTVRAKGESVTLTKVTRDEVFRGTDQILAPGKVNVTRSREVMISFSHCTTGARINFLKYTPTPKNLDYLQRSDVYKLIHDPESPVRGICSRQSKILAEQDYYHAG